MADRTLRNPIIRNALLSWALARLKRGGNPDEVREAIGDMDPSLTYDEALTLIERASSLSYEPLSPNDPYRRVANQLDWSKVKPVQEEEIEREELLMNAEVIRRALEEGIITESEARLYLEPPESREEIERLREEIMRLRLREREREEERRRREMVDRVMNYITQRAIQFNLSPQEANRLRGEVNPNLSYEENLQLVENSIAEIQREREAEEAQRQIQRARQQQAQPPQAPPSPPTPPPTTQRAQPEQQPTPEQVRAELSRMGSRRLRDLGTALLAKDVEQGLTPLEKEMLNAILRILEERGENVSRMIHERLIQGYRWSVRTYYGNEVAYSHFESREEAEKLAERLRKAGIHAEVIPFSREYVE